MECLEAQRIVSERLDRDVVDAALLEEAKEHCRSCEECGSFVKTLATLRMMPLPEPPVELTERIMDSVQTEKAVLAANSAVASSEAATAPEEPVEAEPVSFDRLAEQLKDRRHRKAIVGWVAAAAVVFVVAGIGAMAGVRQILSPARSSSMATSEFGYSGGAAQEFEAAPSATQDSAAGASKSAPGVGTAPSYITVGALIYRLTGEATEVDETTLSTIGTTSSSLGGTQVSAHDVLAGPDRSVVYVKAAEDKLLAFERATRTFSARLYALSGGSITAYGTWPTLPSGVETPTNPDGSPSTSRPAPTPAESRCTGPWRGRFDRDRGGTRGPPPTTRRQAIPIGHGGCRSRSSPGYRINIASPKSRSGTGARSPLRTRA